MSHSEPERGNRQPEGDTPDEPFPMIKGYTPISDDPNAYDPVIDSTPELIMKEEVMNSISLREKLRYELGNHDCEYDSDGAPCNHCGLTAAQAITYFERNINQPRHSEQGTHDMERFYGDSMGDQIPPSLQYSEHKWTRNSIMADIVAEEISEHTDWRKVFDKIADAHNAAIAANREKLVKAANNTINAVLEAERVHNESTIVELERKLTAERQKLHETKEAEREAYSAYQEAAKQRDAERERFRKFEKIEEKFGPALQRSEEQIEDALADAVRLLGKATKLLANYESTDLKQRQEFYAQVSNVKGIQ